MPPPHPTAPRLRLLAAAIIAILLLALALNCARQVSRTPHDFSHFYNAAHAMLHGQDIYASGVGGYIYPALVAFLFQPLALLPINAAAVVWVFLNTALIFFAIFLAAKENVARWNFATVHGSSAQKSETPGRDLLTTDHWPLTTRTWIVALAAIVLSVDKIRAVLSLGQSDCFMLLGFALALRWIDKKPLLAGLAVGATASVKYTSLIFLPYFLVKRNVAAALATLAGFALFLLLPAVELGLPKTLHYNTVAFAGVGKLLGVSESQTTTQPIHGWNLGWERSVSFTSAITRFMQSHNLPEHLGAIPAAILLCLILAAAIVIARRNGVRLFRSNPEKSPQQSAAIHSLEWALLIFLALAFSPQTTARHMVFVALIYTVAAAVFLTTTEKKSRTTLLIAAAIATLGLTLPPPSMEPALHLWRSIAGASWCLLILLLTLVHTATRTISQLVNSSTR